MAFEEFEQFPTVAVLLATHNPSSYLAEQIESIRNQEKVTIRLYWGDYASPEVTKNQIRDLLKGIDFLEFDITMPGPAENFFFLMRQTDEKYLAFSDQDDIWLSRKLINQVKLLEPYDSEPALTHSTPEILKDKKKIKQKPRCFSHSFEFLAVSNCCQGCTIMINKKAKEIVLASLPPRIIWHDWWIGLVISLKGKILLSEEVEVLYRVHDSNTIGIPSFRRKITNFLNNQSSPITYQIIQSLNRFVGTSYAENPIFRKLVAICSAGFATRLIANLTDVRRRNSMGKDILRRVSWTLRKP